ncbi:hypothetical protein THRCLA_11500 [Thraustotheca clavata]|uniref:Fanconi-associated nuclease n=1 Tax=Thraustotheca clavata TaxID=74557 RepID=A0A1V9Y7J9_9STRA|nr:hypothetical protein THRCLA_11500 [Thraustotheca clavata]
MDRIENEEIVDEVDDGNKLPEDLDAYEHHFISVLENTKNIFWNLLSQQEQKYIDDFIVLPTAAQALYARLFQRKGPWFRTCSLDNYLNSRRIDWNLGFSDELLSKHPLQRALKCLLNNGFISNLDQDTTKYLNVLEAIEKACPASEVALIMAAIGASSKVKTKREMLEKLRSHVSSQRRLDGSYLPLATKLQRILYDQACYENKSKDDTFLFQIEPQVRNAFRRMHHLTYLASPPVVPMRTPPRATSWTHWKNQFLTNEPLVWPGLMQNFGRLSYPIYNVTPNSSMFLSKHDLVLYECSRRLRQAMYSITETMSIDSGVTQEVSLTIEWLDHSSPKLIAFQRKPSRDEEDNWKMKCYTDLEQFLWNLTDFDVLVLEMRHSLKACEWNLNGVRPVFFEHFDGRYQLVKGLNGAVTYYEKLGQYDKAVVLLQELLGTQHVAYKRGTWYNRLSLNLQQHLKQPQEAIAICQQGLLDSFLRECDRMPLQKRLERLLKQKGPEKDGDIMPSYDSVTIEGRPLNRAMGEKSRFIGYDDAGCSVEELVLQHFKLEGWYGSHREGLELRMIFGLLLWDVIYMDVPNVFQTPFQDRPLDLDLRYAEHFYSARKSEIEAVLASLETMSKTELAAHITCQYQKHNGQCGYQMHWDIPLVYLQLLASGIGAKSLSSILKLWVHECDSSGMPDLIVVRANAKDSSGVFEALEAYCDPSQEDSDTIPDIPSDVFSVCETQLIEVKGPRDRLSDTQIVWLDRFRQAGITAKVCFVEEPNSKKPNKRQTKPSAPKNPKRSKAQNKSPKSILGVSIARNPQEIIEIDCSDSN